MSVSMECLCAQELVKRTAAVLVDAANDPNGKAAQQIEVRLALCLLAPAYVVSHPDARH